MPVLGIDLGANSTVLATVGRGGVAIIRNDLAERLTPTLVSYTSKERLIGDSALTSLKSNLQSTAQNFKYLLGTPTDWVNHAGWNRIIMYEKDHALAQFGSSPDSKGLLGFRIGDQVVTATEVLAVFLKKLGKIGANFLGYDAKDVVVAVPSWFPETSRQAVIDACVIANMNCLGVMNHTTATALDYGLFRKNNFEADKVQTVAFVDMGYSSCSCTIVDYRPNSLEVIYVGESNGLGGRELDEILFRSLADAFKTKTGCDVKSNAKARSKLLDAAEKAKKVLSANRDTNVHLECLMEDEDLNMNLTRDFFVDLAKSFRSQLEDFLKHCVASSGANVDSLASIEICGGCTRIPFVQETIKTVFGNRDLSRTISGDECVARGAAIRAAMLSPAHKVAHFEVCDRLPHGLCVAFFSGKATEFGIDQKPVHLRPHSTEEFVLFKAGCVVPRRVIWSFPAVFIANGKLQLRIASDNGARFPYEENVTITFSDEQVGRARELVSGAARPGHSIELKLCFEITVNNLLAVGAEIIEVTAEQTVTKKQVPKMNEEGEPIEGQFDYVDEPAETYRTTRNAANVQSIRSGAFLDLTAIEDLKERERQQAARDESAEKARSLANDILTNCFDYRDKLDGVMKEFASGQEKQDIQKLTYELAEWVESNPGLGSAEYQQGWDRLEEAFRGVKSRYDACVRCDSRLENLEKQYHSIRERITKEIARSRATQQCQQLLQKIEADYTRIMAAISSFPPEKHLLSADQVLQCADEIEKTIADWVKEITHIMKDIEAQEKAEKAAAEKAAKAKQEEAAAASNEPTTPATEDAQMEN
eukprot:Gregarina_sp_Poly_1__2888@NODE_1805_length_3296_cov_333_460514_g336_i2_p1_GENE_NODE_1805_length_3296_cov_333_460514_g336_i2NODE_1805_length_3296_cov_333_460514_g336_i2_p1_ORF_typecomplete_len818_score148_34HSP70/PF00012_20/6_6e77HSP70/PF00012_20/6_3HSP70/PF00012_20/9_5e02MreB_Mbl/PF06723_13/6_4e10MreB_Mbl/PF06723_13/1_7e02PilM_2/PF11104_8/4_5e02PilM_2/PF11104_8/0_0045PilM_2/PF11104_8/9_3e02Actin/PF00022_19/0_00074Actin/PF00022_19/1_8e03UPF0061/PF02696_14/0_0018FGGY_C/PF02782_16/0_0042His_Phos_2/